VLEIGVHEGNTAKAILQALPHITRYIGIDVPANYRTTLPIQQGEVPRKPGAAVAGDARFELVIEPRGSYDVHAADLMPKFDAIFIDGDHSCEGVRNDSALAYQLIQPGGVIIWHDYKMHPQLCVKQLIDQWRAGGRNINLVTGTWLAFDRVQ
jgi:predicted O-methyltransferase YrrM